MIRLLRLLWCELFHHHVEVSYSRQGRWVCVTPGCRAQER